MVKPAGRKKKLVKTLQPAGPKLDTNGKNGRSGRGAINGNVTTCRAGNDTHYKNGKPAQSTAKTLQPTGPRNDPNGKNGKTSRGAQDDKMLKQAGPGNDTHYKMANPPSPLKW